MFMRDWLADWVHSSNVRARNRAARRARVTLEPPLNIRALETRQVLNAAPIPVEPAPPPAPPAVVVVDAGQFQNDQAADAFRVVREGDNVNVYANDQLVQSVAADANAALQVNGSGDADTLVVDFAGGNPLANLSIQFNAGAGDQLVLTGGDVGEVAYNLEGTATSTVSVDGETIQFSSDVQVVDQLGAQHRSFEVDGDVAVADGTGDTTSLTTSQGDNVSFTSPGQSLVIDSADSEGDADSVVVESLDVSFTADLSVQGDDTDRVTFAGVADLHGGDLQASAGTIQVTGSWSSSGASMTFTATAEITVSESATLTAHAGTVVIDAGPEGTLLVSGTIDVSNPAGVGGQITLLGKHVGLLGAARLDASGHTGGGTVLLGGDYQGKNPDVRNSKRIYVGEDAVITANALASGNGGKVILWSDEITRFYGEIEAVGGAGGFAEVSGKQHLAFAGFVDLGGGTLLLDPKNITIADGGADDVAANNEFAENEGDDVTFDADQITAILNTGTSIQLQANNDIAVNEAIIVNNPGGNGGVLSLLAGRSVFINADITTDNANFGVGANASGVVDAERDAGVAVIALADGVTIDAGSGNISLLLGSGAGNTETDSGDITIENLTTTGEVTVLNAGSTAGGSIFRASSDSLITAGDLTLQTLVTGGNIGTSTEQIRFTATNLDVTAPGSAFLTSPTTGVNLGILIGVQTGADFSLTAAGNITDSATVSVGGLTSLDAGANNITLNTATNNFGGAVSLTADDVTLVDTNAITLGASTLTGNLDVTAGTSLTVTGALSVTGTVDLDANGGNLTVSAAIDPTTVLLESTDDVLIDALVEASVSITVNAGTDGTGSVIIDDNGTTTDGRLLATDAAADISVSSGATSGDMTIGGVISAGTGTVTLDSEGSVTQSAAITATNLLLTGGGTFTLNTTTNNIATLAANTGGAISYTDADNFTVDTVGAIEGITTTGDAVTLIIAGAGNTLTIVDDLTNDTIRTAGGAVTLQVDDLTLETAGANQAIDAGAGNVTIHENAATRSISLGDEEAGSLSLTDAEIDEVVTTGIVQIGRQQTDLIELRGDFAMIPANAATLLLVSDGDVSSNSGANRLSVANLAIDADEDIGEVNALLINVINFAAQSTVSGNIAVNGFTTLTISTVAGITGVSTTAGGGNFTGRAVGDVTVNSKIDVVGAVDLASTADNVVINADIDPTTVLLEADDDVIINATVVADDSITVNAGTDGTGSVDLQAGGSLEATDAGAAITLSSGSTAGGITVTGSIDSGDDQTTLTGVDFIQATGQLSGSTLLARTFNNAGAAISLTNANNDYATINLQSRNGLNNANTAGPITYVDATGFDIETIGTTSTLALTAGGAITDSGTIVVGGTTSLTAGAANNITLNTATNDFTGAVSIVSANDVTLVDVNALSLGASTVSGDLTADAGTTLTVSGKLTVTGAVDLDANGGNLTVSAAIDPTTVLLESTDDVIINAAVEASDSITVNAGTDGTGNVDLQAAGSLAANDAGATISVNAGATTGNVTLSGTITSGTEQTTITAAGGNINGAGLVTAATVDLNAATGIGDATALELASQSIAADTTNGDIDIDNASAANVTVTSLTTGTGNITFDQSGGGNVSFTTVTTTVDGNIDLENTAGNLTVGTAVTAGGNGDVTLTGTSVILTGTTTAEDDQVTITATTGSINGAGLVTAATVDLNAVTGIGNTTALELAAQSISADTTNGNIDIDNTSATAVTVTSLTTGTGSIRFDQEGGGTVNFQPVTTTDGSIDLRNTANTLTIDNAVSAGGTGSDVILLSAGATSDVVLNANVTAVDDVHIRAGQDILQALATVFITADTLLLEAGRAIGASQGATAIDTRVNTVAARSGTADASRADIFINEDEGAADGDLTVGTANNLIDGGTVSGILVDADTLGDVFVQTENGTLTIAQAVIASGDGNVLLIAGDNADADDTDDLVLTATVTAGTNGTDVGANANGDVHLVSEVRDIVQLSGTVFVIGDTVLLEAGRAIGVAAIGNDGTGSQSTVIDIRANHLAARSGLAALTRADIFIEEDSAGGDLTIGTANELVGDFDNVTTVDGVVVALGQNGDVSVQTGNGTLTVDQVVTARGDGNVLLVAGDNGDADDSDDLVLNATVTAGIVTIADVGTNANGDVMLMSESRDIVQLANTDLVIGDAVLLIAGRGIGVAAIGADGTGSQGAAAIDIQANSLAVRSGFLSSRGDIFVNEVAAGGGLIIGTANILNNDMNNAGQVNGIDVDPGKDGTVFVQTENGTLTVDQAVTARGDGDVILNAQDVDVVAVNIDSDLILNATVQTETAGNGTAETGRDVHLQAARDIAQLANDDFVIGDTVLLVAGRAIGVAAIGNDGTGSQGAPAIDIQANIVAARSGAAPAIVVTDRSDISINENNGAQNDALTVGTANELLDSTGVTTVDGIQGLNLSSTIFVHTENGTLTVDQEITASNNGNVILDAEDVDVAAAAIDSDIVLNADVFTGTANNGNPELDTDVHIRAARDIAQLSGAINIGGDTVLLEAGRAIGVSVVGGDGTGSQGAAAIDIRANIVAARSGIAPALVAGDRTDISIRETFNQLVVGVANDLLDSTAANNLAGIASATLVRSGTVFVETDNGTLTVDQAVTASLDGNVILNAEDVDVVAANIDSDVVLNANVQTATAGDGTAETGRDVHIRAARDIAQLLDANFVIGDTVLLEAGRAIGVAAIGNDGTGSQGQPAIDLRANIVAARSGLAPALVAGHRTDISINEDEGAANGDLDVGTASELLDITVGVTTIDGIVSTNAAFSGTIFVKTENGTITVDQLISASLEGNVILDAQDNLDAVNVDDIILNATVQTATAGNGTAEVGRDVHLRAFRNIRQAANDDFVIGDTVLLEGNTIGVFPTSEVDPGDDAIDIRANIVAARSNGDIFINEDDGPLSDNLIVGRANDLLDDTAATTVDGIIAADGGNGDIFVRLEGAAAILTVVDDLGINTIQSNGQNIILEADNMDLQSTSATEFAVDADSATVDGRVILRQHTNGRGITLGANGVVADLNLSDAEIDEVIAGDRLEIGDRDFDGDITLRGTVTVASAQATNLLISTNSSFLSDSPVAVLAAQALGIDVEEDIGADTLAATNRAVAIDTDTLSARALTGSINIEELNSVTLGAFAPTTNALAAFPDVETFAGIDRRPGGLDLSGLHANLSIFLTLPGFLFQDAASPVTSNNGFGVSAGLVLLDSDENSVAEFAGQATLPDSLILYENVGDVLLGTVNGLDRTGAPVVLSQVTTTGPGAVVDLTVHATADNQRGRLLDGELADGATRTQATDLRPDVTIDNTADILSAGVFLRAARGIGNGNLNVGAIQASAADNADAASTLLDRNAALNQADPDLVDRVNTVDIQAFVVTADVLNADTSPNDGDVNVNLLSNADPAPVVIDASTSGAGNIVIDGTGNETRLINSVFVENGRAALLADQGVLALGLVIVESDTATTGLLTIDTLGATLSELGAMTLITNNAGTIAVLQQLTENAILFRIPANAIADYGFFNITDIPDVIASNQVTNVGTTIGKETEVGYNFVFDFDDPTTGTIAGVSVAADRAGRTFSNIYTIANADDPFFFDLNFVVSISETFNIEQGNTRLERVEVTIEVPATGLGIFNPELIKPTPVANIVFIAPTVDNPTPQVTLLTVTQNQPQAGTTAQSTSKQAEYLVLKIEGEGDEEVPLFVRKLTQKDLQSGELFNLLSDLPDGKYQLKIKRGNSEIQILEFIMRNGKVINQQEDVLERLRRLRRSNELPTDAPQADAPKAEAQHNRKDENATAPLTLQERDEAASDAAGSTAVNWRKQRAAAMAELPQGAFTTASRLARRLNLAARMN